MNNLQILIFEGLFLDLACPRKARQSMSYSISFFLTIIDYKKVLREFLGQMDLTKTQTSCIHKLSNVIIVNKDKYIIFIAFQVVVLSYKSFNNS